MKDVLYVLGLKKNILSISTLDAKGIRVAFVDGQVLMWPKGKKIEDATMIVEEDRGFTSGKLESNDQKNDQDMNINDHFWFCDRWWIMYGLLLHDQNWSFISHCLVMYLSFFGHFICEFWSLISFISH